MAEITRFDDFGGPGEESTMGKLAMLLPENWKLIVGRKIDDRNLTDTDFIVVADNHIFVLEEKHWGPTIITYEQEWRVRKRNGREDTRKSPVIQSNKVGRALLDSVKRNVSQFSQVKDGNRVVRSFVVLSHPNLVLLGQLPDAHKGRVFGIEDLCSFLKKFDRENDVDMNFRAAREPSLRYLTSLRERPEIPETLGDFRLIKELPKTLHSFRFLAKNEQTDEMAILACYEEHADVYDNSQFFFKNESQILSYLRDSDRAWQSLNSFTFERKNWLIHPRIPFRNSSTLEDSLEDSLVERDGNRRVVAPEFFAILKDSFESLQDIYSHIDGKEVLHRLITPKRIWLRPNKKIFFSDFCGAAIRDKQERLAAVTVARWIDEEESAPWRAPEARVAIEESTHKSDVFSLAKVLCQWFAGDFELSEDQINCIFEKNDEIGNLILRCLAEEPESRPNASEVLAELESIEDAKYQHVSTEVNQRRDDSKFGDRYELITVLGEGSFAKAWLARDKNLDEKVVVKEFKLESHPNINMNEFRRARELRNISGIAHLQDRIAEPHSLVYDYAEGENLENFSSKYRDLSVNDFRKISLSILKSLATLHEKQYVHGDISTRNVIVSENLDTCLIDLGMTLMIGEVTQGFTKHFAAPEILRRESASVQSDIYAFSVVILKSILNRYPYEGKPDDSNRSSKPIELSDAQIAKFTADDIAFIRALFRGISLDASERPATASDFMKILSEAWAPSIPEIDQYRLEYQVNPLVNDLRSQFTPSKNGARRNRGLDLLNDFESSTYVPTNLDKNLLGDVIAGKFKVVILTGNPGDGKTAFLMKVAEHLKSIGAAEYFYHKSGWKFDLDGISFEAILDASESHEGMSSDERIRETLLNSQSGNHVSLLAMNDGRMRKFFSDFGEEFEAYLGEVENHLASTALRSTTNEILIVDLKQRSLANLDNKGIGDEILQKIVNAADWSICSSCLSQSNCPIFKNRNSILDSAREPVIKLVLTSHLKRLRRSTFRDLRSAFSWLITGDISCGDVNQATQNMRNLVKGSQALLSNLLFDAESEDRLIKEWAQLDPGLTIHPELERQLIEQSLDIPNDELRNIQREIFLGQNTNFNEILRPNDLYPYQYFSEFIQTLKDPTRKESLASLLLGISRICTFPTYAGTGLAVGGSNMDSGWTIYRVLDAEEFELQTNNPNSTYVESVVDRLSLIHRGKNGIVKFLDISLDVFEVIYGASNGQIYNDEIVKSFVFDIRFFGSQLYTEFTNEILVLSPSGKSVRVENQEGTIVMGDS